MHQNPKRRVTKQLRLLPNVDSFLTFKRKSILSAVAVAFTLCFLSIGSLSNNYSNMSNIIFGINVILYMTLSVGMGILVFLMNLKYYLTNKLKVGMAIELDIDQSVVDKTRIRRILIQEVETMDEGVAEQDFWRYYDAKRAIEIHQSEIRHLTTLKKSQKAIYEVLSVKYEVHPIFNLTDAKITLKDVDSNLVKSIYVSDFVNNDARFIPITEYSEDDDL